MCFSLAALCGANSCPALTRSELVREALARVEDVGRGRHQPRPGSALEAWADAVAVVDDAPADLSTDPRHLAGLGKRR